MARTYTMTEITYTSPFGRGNVRIMGGWQVHIPRVGIHPDDAKVLTDHYIQQGQPFAKATASVAELAQEVFASNWIRGLRNFITRCAQDYERRFDAARGETGELRGFRPEVLAPWYVPFDNTGRAGKPEIGMALEAMWEEATDV